MSRRQVSRRRVSKPRRRPIDRSVRFATWGERWGLGTVVDIEAGRDLDDLSNREAASLLDLIATFQLLRTAAAAVPVLLIAAVLDRVVSSDAGQFALWATATSAILVLPSYMLILGAVQAKLRRVDDPDAPFGTAHPALLRLVRVAPALAVLLAVPVGVLLNPGW